MQACTKTFVVPAGTAPLTVTGIVDHTGTPFVGKLFLFHGNSTVNTLETPYRQSYGFDDGAGTGRGEGSEDVSQFGGKQTNLGGGNWSIISCHAQLFFGGALWRAAKITAVRPGEFDIGFDFNLISGDSISVTVLGGTDLDAAYGWMYVNNAPVFPTGFAPEAVLIRSQFLADTLSVGPQSYLSMGWDTKHSGRGAASTNVIDTENSRYLTPEWSIVLRVADLIQRKVTAWNADGFVTGGNGDALQRFDYVALGGISAAAGGIIQPSVVGVQEVLCGLAPRLLLLLSVGAPPSGDVESGPGTWSFGVYDGTRQSSYWTGETAVAGPPLTGARYLSTADVLRVATPAGGGTTFDAIASAAGFSASRGSFSLDWTTVDATGRIVLWLALGDAIEPVLPGCVAPLPGAQETLPEGCTAPLPGSSV